MHVDRRKWSWDMKSEAAKGTDTEVAGSPKRNHQRRLGPESFKSYPSTPGQVSGRAGGRGRTLRRQEQGTGTEITWSVGKNL